MAEEWGKIARLVRNLEKQGSEVSSFKWLRKRPKFRGIPHLVLEKAEEKGKIPRLVSSSTSVNSTKGLVLDLARCPLENLWDGLGKS